MSIFLSFFSGYVTALPATVLWMLISLSAGSEYFWKSYFIVSRVFLAVSFVLGFIIPALVPEHWKRHPILWLFGQGLLAWLVAILALGLVNLTPLCVGQDNGDGNNDFALCMAQSVMVPVVCSPLEFILLCLTALSGGWLIKRMVKCEET
jgi:hypothetical protein